MRHLDGYRCSAEVRGSFQETAPRKTANNTVKHCDGSVGSVVANHCCGGESSVVVTTLIHIYHKNIAYLQIRIIPQVFFPTCELRIISWWHADCRQVALTSCEMETTHYMLTESSIRETESEMCFLLELGCMAVDFAIIWSTTTSTVYTIFANSWNSLTFTFRYLDFWLP